MLRGCEFIKNMIDFEGKIISKHEYETKLVNQETEGEKCYLKTPLQSSQAGLFWIKPVLRHFGGAN